MGYSAQGQCFATQQAAASAVCASYPITSTSGGVAYTHSCTGVSSAGDTLQLTVSSDASPAVSTSTLSLSFPDCDQNEFYADMTTLWGLSVLAVVTVWGLKQFVLRWVMY